MTASPLLLSLQFFPFLCFSDSNTEGCSKIKLNSQTSANRLPPLSPASGRVSDDPPSFELSDRLTGSRQGRGRGCGDSASLLMSSLSSQTAMLAKISKRERSWESVGRLWGPLTIREGLWSREQKAVQIYPSSELGAAQSVRASPECTKRSLNE